MLCDMQGLIRMVAGGGECDAGSVEWSPTATSRITRAAQCVVFSTLPRTVMAAGAHGAGCDGPGRVWA